MSSPDADPAQPATWQVEPPRPADRGLVGRLLEDVVAEDPSVAPEVAAGTVRAGAWLHRARPSWSGVVVDPARPTRTVVGYVDVLAPSEGSAEGAVTTRHLLVHPSYRDRGVHATLVAAAGVAAAELAGAAPVLTLDDLLPDPDEVTYEPERVSRSRWRSAALGAGAIAAAGAAAVLAVQVASGPLGAALPFLSPRAPGLTSPTPSAAPAEPTTAPSPQSVAVAGEPLVPQPTSGPTTGPDPGPGTPSGSPTPSPSPTAPPTDPPPSRTPGLASLLLDPVVGGLTGTVDDVTGGALSPVTGVLTDTADATTDVLDEVLDGVLGLLPAPTSAAD
ncbi:MAG: hypothetical protein KKE65_03245 [Actinobacteria bacterium]|jgi:hypothetical protein|nr:hypothetical protein [Actinomycetota bacterium]MBU2110651.1 hypothetical protein [Actinomycetota bacterium]